MILLSRAVQFRIPALLVLLAVPMALRLVPPNRFYGYRTAWSLSSAENWYHANLVSGYGIIMAGVLMLGIALGLSSWATGWSDTRYLLATILLQTVVLLAIFLVIVLLVEGRSD